MQFDPSSKKQKTLKVLTFIGFVTTILILLVLGLFQREIFLSIAELIQKYIWRALIVMLTFLGLVTGGVLKNPPKSFDQFLSNTYFQLVVLETFLFSSGLVVFLFLIGRDGSLDIKLRSGQDHQITARLIKEEQIDTILIPRKIPNLKKGAYTVQIIQEEYEKYEETGEVRPGQVTELIMTDDKKKPYIIKVETRNPENSESIRTEIHFYDLNQNEFIDTVFIPKTLVKYREGTYIIKTVDPRYLHADATIIVSASNSEYTIQLDNRKKTGRLEVITDPTGAEIVLNGKPQGVSPHNVINLPFGEYTLELKKSDYRTISYKIELSLNNPIVLIDKKMKRMLRVNFICRYSNTTISFGGQDYNCGEKPLIEEGTYVLTFKVGNSPSRQMNVKVNKHNQEILIDQ